MDRLIRQWWLFMDVHIVILDYHYRILSAFWTFNFHLCSWLPLTEPATTIRTHRILHIKPPLLVSLTACILSAVLQGVRNPHAQSDNGCDNLYTVPEQDTLYLLIQFDTTY